MVDLFANPLFSIALTVAIYTLGIWINYKTRLSILNPMLLSVLMLIALIVFTPFTLNNYLAGGSIIDMMIAPATVALGISIYNQFNYLKKYFWPIMIGCLVGTLTSIGSTFVLCKLFSLNDKMFLSLIPKSVTLAIARPISEQQGGIAAITIASVVVTGISGAVLAPILVRILRLKNPVVAGIAIGASSHACGTSKAIEIGEVEGAMSGLALTVTGLITVLLCTFL